MLPARSGTRARRRPAMAAQGEHGPQGKGTVPRTQGMAPTQGELRRWPTPGRRTRAPDRGRATDVFPVTGMDAVVFAVGNARQAAHYYSIRVRHAAASPTAGRRPAAGTRPPTCSSPAGPVSCCAAPVRPGTGLGAARGRPRRRRDRPGDRGALGGGRLRLRGRARRPPAWPRRTTVEDEHGKVVLATIATYGDTSHTLVERSNYSGRTCPATSPPARSSRRPGPAVSSPRSTTASATSSSAGWTSG